MTVSQIDERMDVLVKTERTTTREILELIRAAEAVRLPEQLGYKDTHEWLIQRHKYSGSGANRRIQAARLLRDIPEVAEKVETGAVNLSTLCKMQTVMRAQAKATGERPTLEAKREAFAQIENKTCSEAEQTLHTLFPEAEVGVEKIVQKHDGGQRMTTELTAEAVKLLERVRELLSHSMPGASTGELIERLAKDFINHNDPFVKAERKVRKLKANSMAHGDLILVPHCENIDSDQKNDRVSVASDENKISKKRNVTPAQRREVIRRAVGQCQYTYENKRCTSRFQLEVDHIIPKAKGGSDDLRNLRCLCRNHNQMMAEKEFGQSFMAMKRATH